MPALIPKIVIDTNVYISAIFWGGKPREIVELGRSGYIWVFSSAEIEKEIDEKLRLKFKLDADEAVHIILDFSTFTIPVKLTKRIEAINDDPDDDKFIECAVSCGADYIVSGDKHLLKLKEYEGIKIITLQSSYHFSIKPNCKPSTAFLSARQNAKIQENRIGGHRPYLLEG